MRSLFFTCLCLLLLEATASAQTLAPVGSMEHGLNGYLAFQQGLLPTPAYSGCQDTYIASGSATTNFGNDSTMVFGNAGLNAMWLYFDISEIPDAAAVGAAVLHIYLQSETYNVMAGSWSMSISRVFPQVVETQATWQVYSSGNAWNAVGAGDRETVFSV